MKTELVIKDNLLEAVICVAYLSVNVMWCFLSRKSKSVFQSFRLHTLKISVVHSAEINSIVFTPRYLEDKQYSGYIGVGSKLSTQMAILDKTRKGLWGRSGNRCAICRTELVLEKDPFDKQLNVGEECHIISQQTNGPRHKIIPDFVYDSGDNLLLLCCNHHKEVDTRIESYPEERLREIKTLHEKWVKENLDIGDAEGADEAPKSKLEILVSLVSGKHDIEMNITSSKEILHSSKGLEIAGKEVESIKIQIKTSVGQIQSASPSYKIEIQDNEHRIVNIRFKGHTFLSQFYQSYSTSASESYLLFAILEGSFMDNGYADPFDKPTLLQIIRLNFDYNDKREFGWRDRENSAAFYKSEDITHEWLEKFFKHVLG